MTERERLIELLNNNEWLTYILAKSNIPHLADYLLTNGVIVPPCKVGDTAYSYCGDFGVVLPYFVENLQIAFMDKDRNYWTYEANCHAEETDELLDEIDFDLDDIGKTVFLTKEEAETALKEREGK